MLVRELFTLGYSSTGDTIPTLTAMASLSTLEQLSEGASLAYRVGVTEGRRDALHRRRVRLYAEHAALAAAVAHELTGTLDHEHLTADLLAFANAQPDDLDPIELRHRVKDRAREELERQAMMTAGLMVAWDLVNLTGQRAAAASGAGEALAGLDQGGGPPTLPAAKAATPNPDSPLLAGLEDRTATARQIDGLAGDVTRAALGSRLAPDLALTAVTDALDGAAGVEFWAEEQLHLAGSLGFRLTLISAGVPMNFVTMGDGHVEGICLGLESQNPYLLQNLPMVPQHVRCRCWHEIADRADWALAS